MEQLSIEDDQVKTVVITIAICSGVSMLGSFFNIFTAYYLGTISHVLGKVVVVLSFLDLIFGITGPLAAIPLSFSAYCQIVSFFVGFGLNGSLIWTCCFAYSCFQSVKKQDLGLVSLYFRKSLVITLIMAIIQAIYAAVSSFKENQDGMCIHIIKNLDFDFQANIIVLLPMLGSIFFCFYCYIVVFRKIREVSNHRNLNLLVYPLILIVCNLPLVTLTIIKQIFGEVTYPHSLMVISNGFWALQGVFNAMGYGLSSEVLRSYRRKCCKKKGEVDSSSISYVSEASYSSPLNLARESFQS